MDYGGATAQLAFLCDGSSYPTATYPALLPLLATAGGSSGTFLYQIPEGEQESEQEQAWLTIRVLAAKGGEEAIR
jgi:hypothetical protein